MFNYQNFLKVGGNFGLIAQYVTAIYCALKETAFGKGLERPRLLYATALIDAQVYLESGDIDASEIRLGAMSSCIYEFGVGFYNKKVYGFFGDFNLSESEKSLVTLVMQLEAMIFCAENTTFGYRQIVDVVYSKKSLIEKIVIDGLKSPRSLPVYQDAKHKVQSNLLNKDFVRDVNSFEC